jgi:DNA-binding Xre family transcriptional regulator
MLSLYDNIHIVMSKRIKTRITAVARERGMSAAELSRKLGLYRSNVSAMDAGKRAASLKLLSKIAALLHCGVDDLIEPIEPRPVQVFQDKKLNHGLEDTENALKDGTERGWVHKALLSWQSHYKLAKLKK